MIAHTYTDGLTSNNLVYLYARWYNPSVRRFISQDTYNLLNRYSYVEGNPVNKTDPTGHSSKVLNVTNGLTGLGNLSLLLTLPFDPMGLTPAFISSFIMSAYFSVPQTKSNTATEITSQVLSVAIPLAVGGASYLNHLYNVSMFKSLEESYVKEAGGDIVGIFRSSSGHYSLRHYMVDDWGDIEYTVDYHLIKGDINNNMSRMLSRAERDPARLKALSQAQIKYVKLNDNYGVKMVKHASGTGAVQRDTADFEYSKIYYDINPTELNTNPDAVLNKFVQEHKGQESKFKAYAMSKNRYYNCKYTAYKFAKILMGG